MATTKTQQPQRRFEKTRQKFNNYKAVIKEAYDAGYNDGWNANIPNTFGARTTAVVGYGNGIRAKQKSTKIHQQNTKHNVKRGK